MKSHKVHLALIGLFFVGATAWGEVQLSSIFTDHMVLQRDKPLPIWGTANPNEKVTVSFAGQTHKTQANEEGKWRVTLDPVALSKVPQSLIAGTVECSDILVGDV
jgi:sialate O-acetylesterase